MNEKINEMLKNLGYSYIGGSNVTLDEIMDVFGLTVDSEGEIIDENGKATGYWYADIEY